MREGERKRERGGRERGRREREREGERGGEGERRNDITLRNIIKGYSKNFEFKIKCYM